MQNVKYVGFAFLLGILMVFVAPAEVYARMGDMGFFGGFSEGRRLPLTTETIILEQGGSRNGRNNGIEMQYRELVFLAGRPVLFEGIIEVRPGSPGSGSTSGTFTTQYIVRPSAAANGDVSITRNITFTVTYRVEGTQRIFTYIVNPNNWSEVIVTPEGTFTLDPQRSSFVVSVLEDLTPGVSYYSGTIAARLVFTAAAGGEPIVKEKIGDFYGFSTAWSATETHRMDVNINNGDWALVYQIRPSVTVNKILQYSANEPTVMSFEGNFREVHQSFAGLRYDIFFAPHFMWDENRQGSVSLETFNVFEQLPAPNLAFLRGHPAEDDIHRLFAMMILQGDPRFFVPEQAITRGQFMTALARAINLPLEPLAQPRARGRQPITVNLFMDVDSNRPEFRYIQAIQRAGIAQGRDHGMFHFDYPISRQEAFATVVRALGLANMGLDPTVITPFADSNNIAYWAIREVSVAQMLGLVFPDESGNIHPNRAISKGEAAALFNYLIEFMRTGLVSEFSEQIVNIAR